MGDVHYMISETSKRVGLESHVLRYWEEELDLQIGRTEMGHRHYTEDDIQLFCCIKELKEQGMLLKDIKNILPDILRTKEQLKEKRKSYPSEPEQPTYDDSIEAIKQLLLDNNKILEEAISIAVSEKVSKDMDFLLQANARQEEEHFRKLDHLIRQQQQSRKETARASAGQAFKRFLNEL